MEESCYLPAGTRIYWKDPAGETSGYGFISKDINVEHEDDIILIESDDGISEAQVYLHELIIFD